MEDNLLKIFKQIDILCVEDEDGIREMLAKTLKYYFRNVYESSNTKEAYSLYEEHRPKIILSDIEMPNGNGIDFISRVRENDLETMVIMLSAYSNEEYLLDLINLNINHFIVKPLNLFKLNIALNKYVKISNSDNLALHNDLYLDIHTRDLIYKNNKRISLRKREKDFLKMLFLNKNSITTYEQIELELWPEKSMTSHALKSFIKELRLKIPISLIKNVPQEGYILLI